MDKYEELLEEACKRGDRGESSQSIAPDGTVSVRVYEYLRDGEFRFRSRWFLNMERISQTEAREALNN